ncbi:PAS domain S-box protein [Paracraurococcus lichenis]|uniref:histidine kinase n=1 Tax=Paracraurococcus lichenis TaxID=3064888 RepID=A0ABT9E7U0_9PROT|nr:PAS domain S-box protein [Paracraurococcus sp. LOR1-02]MDO9712216.1 PAS domain S-box protein [Paracraurococcus sp. LOR1-02]
MGTTVEVVSNEPTEPTAASEGSSPSRGFLRRPPGLRVHLLGLIVAMLLPALLIGGVAAWSLAASYRQSFEARLQDTVRALALFLDAEVDAHLSTVAALASSPLLERDDLAAFDTWARQVGKSVGGWVVVNDAAPGHQQLLNTGLPEGAPMPPPSPPGEGAWTVIRHAIETGRPAVSDFFVGRGTGRPVVAVAAPAMQAGHITRVVVLVMDPARMSEELRIMGLSGTAFASVADSQGRILARSRDHERFVGTVPPSREVPETERARGVFRSQSVYGEPAIYASQTLRAAPGWTVVVAEPYERYQATWVWPLAALAGSAALALATGLAVAAKLARRVLRPITALARQAEALAEGHEDRGGTPASGVAEFETLRLASEQAEAALVAREAEYRAIFETAGAGVAEQDVRTRYYLRVNRRFCEIVGRSQDELIQHLRPSDIVHPDDWDRSPSMRALSIGVETEEECRLVRPDGAVVWVRVSAAVSERDRQGRPLRVVSVVQDVTERRRAEEARAVLAREVDHRAKNALAVVQAAVRLAPKDDPAAYAKAVEGRVTTLARAHTILADAQWTGADLRVLAEAELEAFLSGMEQAGESGPVVDLDGPPVVLVPAATQPISMALHELATNAAKYGALSAPGGRVTVSWSVDTEAGLLRLCWSERGGPPVQGPPSRRGFGSRLIETTLARQLGGSIRSDWQPEGLVWEAELPLVRSVRGGQAHVAK